MEKIFKNKGKSLKLTTLGFTLVEMLSVIIILGILSIIGTITVGRILVDSREKAYNLQIENIKDGAKSWMAKNVLNLKDDNVTLTLYLLKQNGLVESDIKDPNTEEEFDNHLLIVVKRENNDYVYEIVEEAEASTLIEFNEHILVGLYGNLIENISYNETGIYNDKGIIAKTKDNQEVTNITKTITKDNVTLENIPLNERGTYLINYQITYQNYTTTVTRKVIIT